MRCETCGGAREIIDPDYPGKCVEANLNTAAFNVVNDPIFILCPDCNGTGERKHRLVEALEEAVEVARCDHSDSEILEGSSELMRRRCLKCGCVLWIWNEKTTLATDGSHTTREFGKGGWQ